MSICVEWKHRLQTCIDLPLTTAHHDRCLSTEIVHGTDPKGRAAANLLSTNEAGPAVNGYTFFDEASGTSWPTNGLHYPTRFVCRQGREGCFSEQPVTGQGASERQEHAPTRLYDQRGDGIRDTSRLDAVLEDADDAVWLVPAMALTESTSEATADCQVSSVPTTQELNRISSSSF